MSRRSELQAKMEVEQSKQVAWIAKANKTSSQAYAARVTAILAKLESIKEKILADGDCRTKSWGHVGSLSEIDARLSQCGDFIGLDLESEAA